MSAPLLVTIGLETHVQLKSQTKIFCGCALEFAAPPNSLTCPVCLGLPGSLPVLNRRVFVLGLRAVMALGGEISPLVKFDRKNYYYPDLPKGYQISQFDHPLGRGGSVEIDSKNGTKKVQLNRLHLEEDAGKLIHDNSPTSSHVDLNRAGTPLAEIVTEPCLETPEEAYEYLTQLKAILKTIGVSDCDMEKGHLRCDANVSVRKNASDPLGKKVEVKNLNSFKAVKASLEYEILRQTKAVLEGQVIAQETRLWDDSVEKTFSMRSKEEAHDYRYFPDPDLVPFHVAASDIEQQKKELPELPRQKKERYISQYGLTPYDAGLLVEDADAAVFFSETLKILDGKNPKDVANWMNGAVRAYLSAQNKELAQSKLTPALLAKLIQLVLDAKISLQAAKEKVFPEVAGTGGDPEEITKKMGLVQVSDEGALDGWIQEVLTANPKVVEDFKSGKETAAMFLVGQVMKKSQGKANPGKVQDLVRKKLKEV